MQPEMPVGLSGAVEPRSMSLAPGQKLGAALNVASDPTASAGALVFRLNALDRVDPSGHKGSRQATYEVSSPPSGEDGTPPSAPTRLRGRLIGQMSVALSWRASSDNVGVRGYRIYRDGALIATTPETSYDDPTFIDAAVYMVTAYDAAGNESEPSNRFKVRQRRGKTG